MTHFILPHIHTAACSRQRFPLVLPQHIPLPPLSLFPLVLSSSPIALWRRDGERARGGLAVRHDHAVGGGDEGGRGKTGVGECFGEGVFRWQRDFGEGLGWGRGGVGERGG